VPAASDAERSKTWHASQETDASKNSLGEILKQEELRKQHEEELAKTVRAEHAAMVAAAPPAGSPWGARTAPPATTKSLEDIQAEEAQRTKAARKAAAASRAAAAKASPQSAAVSKAAAEKAGPPVSFLQIQKAEEEAKKVLVKRQRALGVETGVSAW
jgi:hypothetical protein